MRSGSSHVLIAILLFAFLLPPLYIASGGPAIWCRDHGILSQRTLVMIYGPLDRVAQAPVVGDYFDWYFRLWYNRELAEKNGH